MLVDTHCHLNFDSFEQDRQAVIARARADGILRVLNPGVDLATSRQALALSETNAEIFAAVGVHPNEATSWKVTTFSDLRGLTDHPKVVAIGEIGLDYYRQRAPQTLQRQVFRKQLELAAVCGLPVVIHTRDASSDDRSATRDALEMLSEWLVELEHLSSDLRQHPGVLHSFSADVSVAHRAGELGFWIGITGPVTFRKADELRRVVTDMPLERLLIETDAPFLTPHPLRGKRNEPAYVRYVAEKIAEICELPFDVVAQATTANAKRLFEW